MENEITFREDPNTAFNEAIEAGRLSADEKVENWAGHYMYMCTKDGVDLFKHRDTRRYLVKK